MMCIERDEINKMLNEKISSMEGRSDGLFKVIDTKLDYISKQTTLTNSRVGKLENKTSDTDTRLAEHTFRVCPQETRIRELEDLTLSTKSIKKFIGAAITFTAIVTTIVIKLLNLIL